MKKLFIIIAAFALTLSLAGCGNDSDLKSIPDEVTMTEVDEFLGRPDVQYVDLRNFDDKMKSGYISGFEMIPFFDYLEYEGILVRTDGDWVFAAEDILNASALRGLFDEDKSIFLMCGSGTRAGYVLAALESLGYTDVYNVGGISTYLDGDAENVVLGDDSYNITMDTKGDFTPGTYFGFDPIGGYMTTVVIGPAGGIVNVVFDAVYGDSTKQDLGDGYMLGSGISWATEANELATYVVANQGWGEIILDETSITGTNADTVPHHFLEINHDGAVDAVAGVSIGVEGFVLSWNAAIAQASSSDLAVVAIDATPAQWASAHEPAFAYTDGIYFGNDAVGGYFVQITVEDGFIVDVFFDAVNGDTTKQSQGFDYGMVAAGKDYEWFQHADMLSDYLVDNQGWGDIVLDETSLTGLNSLTVPHHYLAFDHTVVIDDIAGVTIGAEGFVLAWNNAIVQASTTDHGIVVITADAAAWAAAHAAPYTYTDGVYYGMEEASGYSAKVTVEGGFIVEVFFDALVIDSAIDVDPTAAAVVLTAEAVTATNAAVVLTNDAVTATNDAAALAEGAAKVTAIAAALVLTTEAATATSDALVLITDAATAEGAAVTLITDAATATDAAVVLTNDAVTATNDAAALTDGTDKDTAVAAALVLTTEAAAATKAALDLTTAAGEWSEAVVTKFTSKQVLGFDYHMVAYGQATYEWFQHANMLGDAIVDSQMWSTSWTIVDGHFVVTAQGVIDDVAGVTVGIDGFKAAFDEAISQATTN